MKPLKRIGKILSMDDVLIEINEEYFLCDKMLIENEEKLRQLINSVNK